MNKKVDFALKMQFWRKPIDLTKNLFPRKTRFENFISTRIRFLRNPPKVYFVSKTLIFTFLILMFLVENLIFDIKLKKNEVLPLFKFFYLNSRNWSDWAVFCIFRKKWADF